MGMNICCDTTLLIDLQRERRVGDGPAHRFVANHSSDEFCLPVVGLGEFAAGFTDEAHPVLTAIRRKFRLLPLTEAMALAYGSAYRALRARGESIGANDLWIASSALSLDLPLVTRNTGEFSRIQGLRVLSY